MNRKPIFDTLRRLLGRPFRQSEVVALDDAIDASLDPHPQPRRTESRHTVGDAGLELIRRFEGCARKRADGLIEAYPDPGTGAAPWTIGWGATGPDIGPGTVWTQQQCDDRLAQDLARHAREVAEAVQNAPTSQAQFDALTSFHYNTGAIRRATLLRLHRAGRFEEAADEFSRWTRAGGRVLNGLVRRRAAEELLYRSG